MNLSLGIYIGDLSQFRFELQQRLSQRIYLSSDREDKINQYFSVNIHWAVQHRDTEQSTNKNALNNVKLTIIKLVKMIMLSKTAHH